MGSWSVASGMMLRDILKKEELEEERLKYEEELENIEKGYILGSCALGYLASIDRAGYLRAMGKARQTFKALNPKDKYLGMVKYNKNRDDYYLNADFVYVVEDYYFEMKRGISKEEYKRQKYEWIKKKFLEDNRNDPNSFVKYPREKFGIDKEELLARVERNELICCLRTKERLWVVLGMDEYREEVRKGNIIEIYPLY